MVAVVERVLNQPTEAALFEPPDGSDVAVLVLGGSSGRVMRERARLLAAQGMSALAIRWFGGAGQSPGICEIPVELFTAAMDFLRARGARRIGILGTSKGAEAALVTAVREPRIAAVVALSPTALVWGNVGPGLDGAKRPYRSSWSWQGQALDFVPYDDDWQPPANGPAAIHGWYELSERTFADRLTPAAIRIEESAADLVLVAGGDDRMWPALRYAHTLAERRPARLITHAEAGHRILLPGELPPPPSPDFDYGGTETADRLLGAEAWPHIIAALTGH